MLYNNYIYYSSWRNICVTVLMFSKSWYLCTLAEIISSDPGARVWASDQLDAWQRGYTVAYMRECVSFQFLFSILSYTHTNRHLILSAIAHVMT